FLNQTYSLSTHNHLGVYEPVLGNPSTTGYVLSSTDGGVRSWIAIGSIVEDDILYWDDTKYIPYSSNVTAGSSDKFYLGNNFISASDLRLNYTGGFYVNSNTLIAIYGNSSSGYGIYGYTTSGDAAGIFTSLATTAIETQTMTGINLKLLKSYDITG